MLQMYIDIQHLAIYLSKYSPYPNRGMPSIDELTDNFFSCEETPLWFPSETDISKFPVCKSCVFRFSAPVAGPGVLLRPNGRHHGFDIDENPQTSITFNGIRYSYRDCVLAVPGSHRLTKNSSVADAELQIFFRSDGTARQEIRAICLPVNVGSGTGNEYFRDFGKQLPSRARTLASLLTNSDQWYMYVGSSFQERKKDTRKTDALCRSNLLKTTFMVKTTPIFIQREDLARIMSQLPSTHQGPPVPFTPVSLERIYSFITVVPSTLVEGPEIPKPVTQSTTVSTKQLKCRRIDASKDIKNGEIYIGGEKRSGDTTLQDELDNAANLAKAWEETGSRIQPGDFENILGGILATVLALVVLGLLAYFTLKITYKDYVPVIRNLYDKTKNPVKELVGKSMLGSLGEKLHIC